MCPAIFFKINPIRCLNIFKHVVKELEKQQNIKYPHHYEDKEFLQSFYLKFLKQSEETRNKTKVNENMDDVESYLKDQDDRIESEILNEMKVKYDQIINKRIESLKKREDSSNEIITFYENYYNKLLDGVISNDKLYFIDKNRPHPEFCFNHMGIDSNEMRKIKRELQKNLGTPINYEHPFMIGIERGIVPYYKDMEVPFQRIAQSLFSQKKIPIVISDESLGYGINLPIRTVVMLGEESIEEINPVIANQMTGRSGRRGIDREGHIVFVAVNWKNILKSEFPILSGTNPINNYLPLPYYFQNVEDKDKIVNKKTMTNLFKNTLYNSTFNIDYDPKESMKNILNYIKKFPYARKAENALLIWACRDFGNNSFHLPLIVNRLIDCDEVNIFHTLTCLFDDIDIPYDENEFNQKMKNIFDGIEYSKLKNGLNLLSIYKSKKVNNQNDINRLKKIANLISIIHIIIKNAKYDKIINRLQRIFENLKIIIKKNLF